jgi:hypothetical protein
MRRLLVLVSAFCVVACMMTVGPTAQPQEVRVSRDDFGTTVGLVIGQALVVPMPNENHDWQVDVPRQLELLTPADQRRNPGAGGWRFRAIAAGDGDIKLTLIPKEGDAAPPEITLTVHVTQ